MYPRSGKERKRSSHAAHKRNMPKVQYKYLQKQKKCEEGASSDEGGGGGRVKLRRGRNRRLRKTAFDIWSRLWMHSKSDKIRTRAINNNTTQEEKPTFQKHRQKQKNMSKSTRGVNVFCSESAFDAISRSFNPCWTPLVQTRKPGAVSRDPLKRQCHYVLVGPRAAVAVFCICFSLHKQNIWINKLQVAF